MPLVIQSLNHLLEEEWPDDTILGDGLLIKGGTAIIYGPPGWFKSYAAEQLAFSLSSGDPFFGISIKEPQRTLYVQAEIAPRRFQMRTDKMREHYNDTRGNIWFLHAFGFVLDGKSESRQLTQLLAELRPDVLIIDPLTNFLKGSENNDSDIRFLFRDILDSLRRDIGCAIVLVHHERKPSYGGGPTDGDLRGHGHILGWPDTILRVKPVKKRLITVNFQKTRNADSPPDLWLSFNTDKELLELSDESPARLANTALASGPLTIKEFDTYVRRATQVGQHKARQIRQDLISAGAIEAIRDPTRTGNSKLLVLPEEETIDIP